MNLKILSVIS